MARAPEPPLSNANALLAVREGGLVKSTTFHVWDLYLNHFGTRPLRAAVSGPSVTLLDVSATASADGSRRYLAVINRSSDQDIEAVLSVEGETVTGPVTAHSLGDGVEDAFAVNTIEEPDTVALRERSMELDGGRFSAPAHSVRVLEWEV